MNVGIRELRDGLSRYVAAAREGEEIIVTDHGRAVARLISYDSASALETLMARGLITPASEPYADLPDPIVAKGTVSDLIAEQRR